MTIVVFTVVSGAELVVLTETWSGKNYWLLPALLWKRSERFLV